MAKQAPLLLKIGLFFIVPCAIILYFGNKINQDRYPPLTIKWNDERMVAVEEIDAKRFGEIFVKRGDDSLSSDTLDSLLREYGIDSEGMDPQDIKQRTDLLLRASSPDFWRKNYAIHPNGDRVTKWLSVHQTYLELIQPMIAIKDKEKLRLEFMNFCHRKVTPQNEFEENVIYTFIKDDLKLPAKVFDDLKRDHKIIDDMAMAIRSDLDDKEKKKVKRGALKQFKQKLKQHYMKEEQNIVRILLMLDPNQHKIYKGYIRCSRYHPDRCATHFI
eukprot:693685_1